MTFFQRLPRFKANQSPEATSSQLPRRYVIALLLVAALATTAYMVLSSAILHEETTGTTINVAGRQRMLSQRVALFLNQVHTNPNAAVALTAAEEALDLFEKSHLGLVHGNSAMGLSGTLSQTTHALYFGPGGLDAMTRDYFDLGRNAVRQAKQGYPISDKLMLRLNDHAAGPLLKALDGVVGQFERESKAASAKLERIELAVLIATLVLLIGEAIFIFRPAVRQTVLSIRHAKTAEEKAKKAAHDRKLVLDTISHELRTPLSQLIAATKEFEGARISPALKAPREAIAQASRDIFDTVEAVLNFASLESDKTEAPLRAVHLPDLIDTVLNQYRQAAENKHIQLYGVSVGDLALLERHAMLDHDPLLYTLGDLVDNAVRFTTEGRVIVEYQLVPNSDEGHLLRITVSDTGIGISNDRLASIFEPFESGARYGDSPRGLGLGLAYAQRVLTQMGGTIAIKSKSGSGTRVTIEIPTELADVIEAEQNDRSSLRCLVAEDNPVNLIILKKILTDLGHEVFSVTNGEEAVTAACTSSFDVILLDIVMPVMSGDAACLKLKGILKEHCPPLIAVTANTTQADVSRYLLSGFSAVVAKPIRIEHLSEALKR